MASGAGVIKVEIALDKDGLVSGLNLASANVASFAQSTRQAFGEQAAAATGAAQSHTGLLSVLKEEKAEMRLQAGLVRMFSSEMKGLGVDVGAAGEGLLSFGSALAIGGGAFGIAVAAVQAVIAVFRSFADEAKKAKEEAAKFAETVSKELNVALEELAVAQLKNQGLTEGQIEQWKQGNKQAGEHTKLIRELGEAQANLRAFSPMTSFAGPGELDRLKEAVAVAERNLEVQKKIQANARTAKAAEVVVEDDTKRIEKAKKDAEREAAAAAEVRRRAAEKEQKDAAEVSANIYAAQMESEGAFYAERARRALEEQKATELRAKEMQGVYGDLGKTANKSVFDQAQKSQEEVKQTIALATQAGETIGDIWGEVAAGEMKAADAMKKTLAEGLKMAVKAAITEAIARITASAAIAAGAAASSQAGVPVVGPALAAGAMAAVGAMVLGLLDRIPSAAGGWGQVPRDTLMLAHKDEMMLPAPLADRIRDMTKGSGGGEVHNHFTITAFDAKDVERVVRDNASAFNRALRDIDRRRVG